MRPRTRLIAAGLTACAMAAVGAGCDSSGSAPLDRGVVDLPLPDTPRYTLDQAPGPADRGGWTDGAPPADRGAGPDVAAGPVLTAPLALDFEADDGQLTGSRDWEWGHINFTAGQDCDSSATYPPGSGHSGTGMWGTKLDDCYSALSNNADPCGNVDTSDDSVLTLQVQIPASFQSAKLTYWEWANHFLEFDWSEVRINGKVARQTCTGTLPEPPTWTLQTIDLQPHIGQTVTIQFLFMASGVINQAGWYIDDISVVP